MDDYELLPLLYAQKVENYIWSDYLELDKYQKVYAFSVKGIDDIELINETRLAFFNPDDIGNLNLTKETKQKYKDLGIKIKDIETTINGRIMSMFRRYLQMIDLIASDQWRIVSGRFPDAPLVEQQLDNVILDRNDYDWNMIYPPNHPCDTSRVSALTQKQADRKNAVREFDLLSIDLHPDYDFNIAKFLKQDLK